MYDRKQDTYILDSLNNRKFEDSLSCADDDKTIDKAIKFNLKSGQKSALTSGDISNALTLLKSTDGFKQILPKDTGRYLSQFDYNLKYATRKTISSDSSILETLGVIIQAKNLLRTSPIDKIIYYYQNKLDDNFFIFEIIITLGFSLFLPGLFLWYTKTQIIQDELLKMQLAEARMKSSKTESKPPITGRKHFDPKVLPRPEARNLR
ncbi:hypothetical protein [Mucilaginibacter ginsenosidivorax]|uniref:hypothetical protein n=1 Tax=Mucilaginibacter ginsenosidivorax TaxID=862126 RepID=UPI001CEF6E72|nr:hypothetical protein [Mucilaginibacter ginsenosidivorax]